MNLNVEPSEHEAYEAQALPLGHRLFIEVEQHFETVSGLVEDYGWMTLVDLWWLAHVLNTQPHGFIETSCGSRIADVLAQLPSGAEFRRYVVSEFGQLI